MSLNLNFRFKDVFCFLLQVYLIDATSQIISQGLKITLFSWTKQGFQRGPGLCVLHSERISAEDSAIVFRTPPEIRDKVRALLSSAPKTPTPLKISHSRDQVRGSRASCQLMDMSTES